MKKAELVMRLGFGDRAYHDLDAFERFVWAERLRAYCIFPNDTVGRNRYQACKSAYRIQGLESQGPKSRFPRKLGYLRAVNRARYLREERAFFRSVGGTDALLTSYGLDIYKEYERISTIQCWHLMRIAFNLMQLHNTTGLRAPQSLAKAVGIVTDSYRIKRKKSVNDDKPDSDVDLVIGQPTVKGLTGGNEKYLLQIWRHYKSALPLCVTYGFVFFSHYVEALSDSKTGAELDQIDESRFAPEKNMFSLYTDETVPWFLMAKQFLTTHYPHSQKIPHLRPGEHWDFTSGFTKGFSSLPQLPVRPLGDIDFRRAQSHRAPPKKI